MRIDDGEDGGGGGGEETPPKTYFCFWSLYLIRKPLIGLTHYKVVLVANMNEP